MICINVPANRYMLRMEIDITLYHCIIIHCVHCIMDSERCKADLENNPIPSVNDFEGEERRKQNWKEPKKAFRNLPKRKVCKWVSNIVMTMTHKLQQRKQRIMNNAPNNQQIITNELQSWSCRNVQSKFYHYCFSVWRHL